MDHVKTENGRKAALDALERALETPIISGELTTWVETVENTWREASAQLERSLEETHPQQYQKMAEAELEMLPRIDQLRAEDQALTQLREKLDHEVSRAVHHVPKLEPDEAKAQKHVQSLIDDAMAFVIRVRKQEVAVETWFVEAFNRDRGAVD